MEKLDSAVTPETWGFSLKPVTEETFAETVRQWVANVSHVSADKISVTVTDAEICIAYDVGTAQTAEMEIEL